MARCLFILCIVLSGCGRLSPPVDIPEPPRLILPVGLTQPTPYPVQLPENVLINEEIGLAQADVETLWGIDRRELRQCGAEKANILDAIEAFNELQDSVTDR